MSIFDAGNIDDVFPRAVESTKAESPQVPSPGRIVHYVAHLGPNSISCFPAIVRRVRGPANNGAYIVDLVVFAPDGTSVESLVAYDDKDKLPLTWHWPERVTTDAELFALDRHRPGDGAWRAR